MSDIRNEQEKKIHKKFLLAVVISVIVGMFLSGLLAFIVYKYFDIKYLVVILAMGVLVFGSLLYIAQRKKMVGLVLNIVLCICLLIVDAFALKIAGVTGEMTDFKEVYTVKIIKREDSKIDFNQDFFDYTLGYVSSEEYFSNWGFNLLDERGRFEQLKKIGYKTYVEMFDALKTKEIDLAILSGIGEAELEELSQESEEVYLKYIVLCSDRQEIELKSLKPVNVNKQGFTVLIHGVDLSSKVIEENARSDVNMLITVNPNTGKINIQTIPRDSYAEITCTDGKWSKLNRALEQGGTKCAIETIEKFFDNRITINFYARINFAGFEKLVDAVGGVTVDNPVSFTVTAEGIDHHYKKGIINLNGEEALLFCRGRKMLAGNDLDRGKNQMRVLTGIVNKFMAAPSLDKMNNILSAIKGNFMTSFQESDFVKLFNMAMSIKDKMEIVTNTMSGTKFYHNNDAIYRQRMYYYDIPAEQKEQAIKRILDTISGN